MNSQAHTEAVLKHESKRNDIGFYTSGPYSATVIRNVHGTIEAFTDVVIAGAKVDIIKRNFYYEKKPDQKFFDKLKTRIEPLINGLRDNPEFTARLSNQNPRIIHGIIGMCTEAAEMMESVVDALVHDKPLDLTNLHEELGDSEWYRHLIVDAAEAQEGEGRFTDSKIWEANAAKLEVRYAGKAIHGGDRNLEAEAAAAAAAIAVDGTKSSGQ